MARSRKNTKDRMRDKGKRRKTRKTRKYGQAPLKYSHMGAYSCWYAAGAFLLIMAAVGIAFRKHGAAAGYIGGFGILAMVFSILGIRAGVKGFREREKRYIFCRLGIAANILILLVMCIIFMGGIAK